MENEKMELLNENTKIYPGDFIKYICIKDEKRIGHGFFVKKILHDKYPETKSWFLLKNDHHCFKINMSKFFIYHSPHNPRNNFKMVINFLSENY